MEYIVRYLPIINSTEVKFFLTSHDIKPGDKVTVIKPDSSITVEGTLIQLVKSEDPALRGFTGCEVEAEFIPGKLEKGNMLLQFCFKVLGEISPDATWITIGDRVNEEDIKLSYYSNSSPIASPNDKISLEWFQELQKLGVEKKYSPVYKIKGLCGHFH